MRIDRNRGGQSIQSQAFKISSFPDRPILLSREGFKRLRKPCKIADSPLLELLRSVELEVQITKSSHSSFTFDPRDRSEVAKVMGYISVGQHPNHTDVDSIACSTLPISSTPRGRFGEMDYIGLAIEVLKTQDPHLIHSLTDFLTILPSPKQIQNILQDAVDCLAQIDENTHRWILDNSGYLMPYLNLMNSQRSSSSSEYGDRDCRSSRYCP